MAYVNPDFDILFKELVPDMGPASCLAGELVRATMKIGYRFYNDGDHIGIDYGNETCNAAARFIIENAPNKVGDIVQVMWGLGDEKEYEACYIRLEDAVTDYVIDHPELREQETDDMLDYSDPIDYLYDNDEEDEDEY